MNLIEQQSAAKDLPMQYLQQAVNGQNPNLTPWIATAELQRRTTMNQHMAPQGPQGPQPTVKDQVEQKAGLMATQAAQQAQAAQAQQGAAPPGPVPGGIPQPEPQPQEPVMAARGGLMNAPVNFKFAHGGILGYADGGEATNPNARKMFIDEQGVERYVDTGQPVPKTQSNVRAAAEQYSTEPTQAASLPAAIAEQRALQKEFGTDKPMGVEERALMEQRRKAYEDYKGRAGDRAFAALVQGARAGPGQSGAMYEQARGQEYKDAAEFQREQYKDIAALNTAQRAAAEKQQAEAGTAFGAAKTASAAERAGKATLGANIYGTQEQAKASKYSADKHAETALAVQKLQDRAATARQNSSDQKQALAELAQLERSYDADIKSLESQMRPLVGLFTPEAKAQVKELSDQLNLARDLKRRVRGGPAAAAPAGTMTPPPPGAVRLKNKG